MSLETTRAAGAIERFAMLVGVPKEIKDNEYRVGIVRSTVRELTDNDYLVLIEAGAGSGAGLPGNEYEAAGAVIVANATQSMERPN